MQPTYTSLAPRADQTSTNDAPIQKNSSIFTFLIALLILLGASGAIILRAILRRRQVRQRVQAAINAGILLPAPSILVNKPELFEVWVRSTSGVQDWHALMPLCAAKVSVDSECKSAPSPMPPAYYPSPTQRLAELLGHRTPSSATVAVSHPELREDASKASTVQVTVLIAMPSEHPSVPSYDACTIPDYDSPKGKQKDLDVQHDDPDVPDVMLGVSKFIYSETDILAV